MTRESLCWPRPSSRLWGTICGAGSLPAGVSHQPPAKASPHPRPWSSWASGHGRRDIRPARPLDVWGEQCGCFADVASGHPRSPAEPHVAWHVGILLCRRLGPDALQVLQVAAGLQEPRSPRGVARAWGAGGSGEPGKPPLSLGGARRHGPHPLAHPATLAPPWGP